MYACPFCAEQIQDDATTCRFCNKDVLVAAFVDTRLPKKTISEVAKVLSSRVGLFGTYGAIRKALHATPSRIGHELRNSDVQILIELLQPYRAKTRVIPIADLQDTPDPNQHPKSRFPNTLFLILAVCAFAIAIWIYRPSEPTVKLPLNVEEKTSAVQKERVEPGAHATSESENSLQALVTATATITNGQNIGSAFFVRPDGYLLTNHHVTANMSSFSVITADGKSRPGQVFRFDPNLDLSVVKVEGDHFPTLPLGDATQLQQGDAVWTIGAPHGLSFTMTRGIVSFVGRQISGRRYIQADVAINPGNSGGPMINAKSEVVGLNNFIISNAVGLNFAIPINFAYMGINPILSGLVSTPPDNPTMASWRTSSDEIKTLVSKSDDPVRPPKVENGNLVKDVNALTNRFQANQKPILADIAQLEAEIADLQRNMASNSESITAEQDAEKRIKMLKREKLEKEIVSLETTVQYTTENEGLLRRLQEAVSNDPRGSKISAKIEEMQRLHSQADNALQAKRDELKTF